MRTGIREVEIILDADLFLRMALVCVAMLAMLGGMAACAYVGDVEVPRLLISAFLLDSEANLPTLFACSLLVFCSLMLVMMAARAFLRRQTFKFHWALLGVLFALIAFDEAAGLHERLNQPTRAALDASGAFYFAWVIPVGIVVAVLTFFYLPLLRGLPAPIARLFVLSGGLYVGGALGAEMIGAPYFEVHGRKDFTYQLLTIAEETLEMLGLAVFGYALIRFLARHDGRVCLGFRAR